MQKTVSFTKFSSSAKSHSVHLQTEELIADMRAVQTPSQRVEEKLAACSGFSRSLVRRDDSSLAPRRPR